MNNEDKILSLLEKMASDVNEVKGDVGTLKQGQAGMETHIGNIEGRMDGMETHIGNIEGRMDGMDTRMENLEAGQNILARQVTILTEEVQDIRQSQVRMENELTDKVRALFDAREVQNDVNERIIAALTRIENKLDNQSLEIKLTATK